MNVFGWTLPIWVLDWSGSVLVAISLWYLFTKHLAYWHFSNASLVPYGLLFVTTHAYMLAGLQVSYLIYGVHGLYVWHLERQRDTRGLAFNERFWYPLAWILSLAIFAWTATVTSFTDNWVWLQFVIVSLSLLANWSTTRKWIWSWPVWLVVNTLQAVYFYHFALHGQFTVQFVLFAMSVYGWHRWVQDRHQAIFEANYPNLPPMETHHA